MSERIKLFAGIRSDGSSVYEEVHVERLGDSRFRVEQSPGLVLGIAAGDVVEVAKDAVARVVSRGGNISIQVYAKKDCLEVEGALLKLLPRLNGRIDGTTAEILVLTIPVSSGFLDIERMLRGLVKIFPQVEWFFGNVYDPIDGTTPLNWWK